MKSYRKELWFNIAGRRAFIRSPTRSSAVAKNSGIGEGLVLVNAMHITASVFINDDETGLPSRLWHLAGKTRSPRTGFSVSSQWWARIMPMPI